MDKTVLRDKVYGGWFGKCLGGAVDSRMKRRL